MKQSKHRIKRLRGLRQPQYRLRVAEIRLYCDIEHDARFLKRIAQSRD